MTELLYLDDSYLKEFFANIASVAGNKIELDKTAFYPRGGGQLGDTGKIIASGKEYAVKSVEKVSGKVLHEMDSFEGLQAGMEINGAIDWERRYRMMRMHSAAHVLAAVIYREIGSLITGNQLGFEESRMDYNVKDFDRNLLQGFEEKANEIVVSALPIAISYIAREEAMKIPEIFRLRDLFPKVISDFRVISIGDYDRQADGGTHVRNTKEIGKIKITRLDNKGAENRRIYFELAD